MKKTVSAILFALLLIGMLTPVFIIRTVKASGTIYIRADGSIESTTDISTLDNITYTFTNNITDEIVIERNNIVVDGAGYTLQGTGSGIGITLELGRSNVTIKNVEIESFFDGIRVYGSENTISGNTITNSNVNSIYLYESSNNTISRNTITNNGRGIWLTKSSNNTISGNTITNNDYSIRLEYSSDFNSVSENTITNNGRGIAVSQSGENTISGNYITQNVECGIFLGGASKNTISRNNVIDNGDGIHFEYLNEYSNYNRVSGNNITNNEYGIVLLGASGNIIYYNNFVDNTQQANACAIGTHDSINIWDNGYPAGGNYWSNYTDVDLYSYLYQNVTGGDGIGDTPFVIDENNQDNYPLIDPLTAHELVASITAPPLLQLGSSASLNTTVTNRGLNDEANVGLILLINGTIVESTTTPLLQSGDSHMLNYSWTPTVEGAYNVTAYVNPSPEEAFVENNQITEFVTVAVPVLPTPPEVGVKAGDWIKLDYTVTSWPSGTPYPAWLKVEVLIVAGTTATVQVTMHMSDGTEQRDTVSVDVVAGGGTFDTLFGFVIPANCTTGDSIVMGGDDVTFDVTLEGETTRTCAGASRTVVYASFSEYGAELTYYWDKATGILVEASTTSGGVSGTAKATETNMWAATPAPFWMEWWLWAVVAVVVVALAGGVYFLRRRGKALTPTASIPETEG